MSGRRLNYCLKHKHGFYVTDGCYECNEVKRQKERDIDREREFEIEQQRQYESEAARIALTLKQFCIRCKKWKAWYSFKVHKSGRKEDTCFKCQESGNKSQLYLDHIRIEHRLERLITSAMKNKMPDLRNHLFETLEKFKDNDKDMTPERVRGICQIAQTIINSVKIELDFIRAIGGKKSEFLQSDEENDQPKLKAINS